VRHLRQTDIHLEPERSLVSCRDRLFLTDPGTDRDTTIRLKGSKTHGTCEWILRDAQFQAWLLGKPKLLWVQGGPGKGKTMMSIFLTQNLDSATQRTVIYYFCSGSHANRNNATSVLRGLLWQLTTRHPDLAQYISHHFEPPERAKATLSEEETLWSLFLLTCKHLDEIRLFCVVDGIDECDTDSMHWLASRFATIEAEAENTNSQPSMIVLSRSVVGFESCHRISLDLESRSKVHLDVETFVRTQVKQLSQRLEGDRKFSEYLVNELLDKSEGTFLWVGYVMGELRKKGTPTAMKKAMQQMPRGLPALYARMLHDIEPEDREESIRLLTWVTMSLKPLSLETLNDVLRCRETDGIDQKQAILDSIAACSPMVEVQGANVGFVHQSARDYLVRSDADLDPVLEAFRIKPQTAHLEITRQCLQALERGTCLQYYALLHWPRHAKRLTTHAASLLELESSFFGVESCVRERWWYKFSKNFPGLPDTYPPRLHIACFLGLRTWAQSIIRACEDSNREGGDLLYERCLGGWMPWEYAAEVGSTDVTIMLLDRSLSCGNKGGLNTNVLVRAACAGHPSTVKALIEHGADRRRAIHEAIRIQNLRALRLLVSDGVDLNFEIDHIAPLHLAVKNQVPNAIRMLLKYGAEPNLVDHSGWSALHHAADLGYLLPIQVLCDGGADLKIKNQNGDTALDKAVQRGYNQIVIFMIQHDPSLS
jgi:hypothetical protein